MKKTMIFLTSILISVLAVYAGFIAWQPLSVTVTGTSKMIVPPVTIKSASISDWEASTAYVYGDFVNNTTYTKRQYWCTSAGTSESTNTYMPSSTDGDYTNDTSVTWRFVRPERRHLAIYASSNCTIYLGFGNDAVAGSGIAVTYQTPWIAPSGKDCPQGAVYAISAGGTNTVGVQEN